jgi:hypothetical protein
LGTEVAEQKTEKIVLKFITVNRILWAVYLSLLGVLLPHTAWAFQNFEPETESGGNSVVAWTAAFAFEASIAVLMHKLSGHIDRTPRRLLAWAKFQYRYLNAYSLGLLAAIAVSSLANLAHAVEFGRSMAIFTLWKISLPMRSPSVPSYPWFRWSSPGCSPMS